jgi:hypothetical protein
MDGKNEHIKKISERIEALWEEIIIKEKINNITINLNEIKKDQTQMRQIVREELTNLWNASEIPTFKIILEKLKNIEEVKINKQIIKKSKQSEIVPINAWRRTKEPIMVDISKMKPEIPKSVDNMLNGLSLLQKEGKF